MTNRIPELDPILGLRAPGVEVLKDFDLTKKTSMKMHATTAAFGEAHTPAGLQRLLGVSRQTGVPTYILGGGKNTLFATSYFEGLVVSLGRGFARMDNMGGNCIRAGAGVQLPALLKYARQQGLMGLEFLTMVPGTVGGSLAGNAGAGNWGICDFVERVYIMTRDGFVASIKRNEFRYGYRHSDLREAIVLEAEFRLEPFLEAEHNGRIEEFKAKKTSQPYNLPSCGCIFKNPKLENGQSISAGKLIDECGLKGYAIQSAMVSDGHANFIVNVGESRGEDFLALINLVRDIVQTRTGIELELEVQIVGGPLTTAILA